MSIIKRFRVLVAALLIAGAAGVCALPEAANAQSTAATAGNASADSASAPVAPPAPSAKATEVVENPYGLDALWKTGDFVAKGTLVILVIMSMGTWYILVVKLVEQNKLFRQYKAAKKTFWTAGTLQDGANTLAEGNARRTRRDRLHFFSMAQGSAMECAAAIDVLRVTGRVSPADATRAKHKLTRIVQMLVGLRRSR